MPSITSERTISASASAVFHAVADIENFSKAVPEITKVEMLSEVTSGVGARFRETRAFKGREAATELEVTEYEPDQRVRIVSDTHGTVWDTVFTVRETPDGSHLTMVMDARPHKLVAKLTVPLTLRLIRTALENDLDAVKDYCESKTAVA